MAQSKKTWEKVEDESFETVIESFTKARDFEGLERVFNNYGNVLEARAQKESTNA